MSRLLRHTLNGLTLLSAALCVAAVVLWVRSYRAEHSFAWGEWPGPQGGVLVNRGALWFFEFCPSDIPMTLAPAGYTISPTTRTPEGYGGAHRRVAGCRVIDGRIPGGGLPGITWHIVIVPCWLPCLLAGVLPALRGVPAGRRWKQRRRRRRLGRCPRCGYDLRATPGRCPECGAVPDGAA